jgi:methyltransferase family protein
VVFLSGLERIGRYVHKVVSRLPYVTRQSDALLVRESQLYWQDQSNESLESFSHWRGKGPFIKDELWLGLGKFHLELFEKAASWSGMRLPVERIVEWGSGGGMNAVHFASHARQFYGVDISSDSLMECAKQVAPVEAGVFIPILIEAAHPEVVCSQISRPIDLFLCTYVFELIPSPEYGLKIMQIAHGLLRSGGIALVQLRYHTGLFHELSKRRNYAKNMVHMTSYALDEFWTACQGIGFTPLFIKLLPKQPELNESRYAYYAMVKEESRT